MTITGQNMTMYRGDTKKLVVTVTDESGAYPDISGSDFNWVVYKRTPGNIVLSKVTPSGISIINPLGVIEITLDPEDTENLLGLYLHECEITDTLGNISTIFTGSFTVIDSKA